VSVSAYLIIGHTDNTNRIREILAAISLVLGFRFLGGKTSPHPTVPQIAMPRPPPTEISNHRNVAIWSHLLISLTDTLTQSPFSSSQGVEYGRSVCKCLKGFRSVSKGITYNCINENAIVYPTKAYYVYIDLLSQACIYNRRGSREGKNTLCRLLETARIPCRIRQSPFWPTTSFLRPDFRTKKVQTYSERHKT
jgi:hypothetical protein